ncbi:hypothetical protein ACPV5L_10455 [Vibrio astriarenae]|jgi:hypothetical protein|uniref:hypothetical protein n=1 Tax=Vibrio agarivorans TaxID=153622 RepID=UPI00222EF14E|nr:hypothetical protein [Vibrio agarivorans]MDN3662605.1 hypothetical protein [Vibrio agarivorans]
MNKMKLLVTTLGTLWVLAGCANPEPLGTHVAKLQSEQIYNPNASIENLGYVPTGSGERMEGAYQIYTGRQSKDLKGTDSQFVEGFSSESD